MPEPAPGGAEVGPEQLRLGHRGLRRFGAHLGLLAALLAVFTVCSAAAGSCLLLLTAGEQRALSQAVARADGNSFDGVDLATLVVLADSSSDTAPDAATLLPLVRETLRTAAGSYPAAQSIWVSSQTLFIDGPDVRRGYLVEADAIGANATLASGTWPVAADPGAPIPVAVPAAAADELGVRVGSKVRLASDRSGAESSIFDMVVSGIFSPAETPFWSRDELDGRGYDPDHLQLPTFGPFVAPAGTLAARSAPIDQVVAELDPSLGGDAAGVPAYLERLDAAPQSLQDQAGPAVGQVLVRSQLGAEFERWRTTVTVSEALMATVFLLVLALGAATTALIAAVLARRRAVEHTLLRDRGASNGQLVGSVAAEASVIAALAAVLAAPMALLGYRLTAPGIGGWWPWPSASVQGWGLVAALLLGAAIPAAVVVLGALPPRSRGGRTSGAGVLVRSGADLMLAGVAVLAYLQLRSHVATPGSFDPFLAGAPAVAALAVAALLARLLPLLCRLAERAARRGRGLVLPLAGWQLASGGATSGVFLVVLATAVGTLGTTFLATWTASSDDQASALVGTQIVVNRAGGAAIGQQLSELAGGPASPVSDRPIVLGSRPDGVPLLAVDVGRDQLLAGRPPSGGWTPVLAGLRPQAGAVPLTVPGGPIELTLTGARRPGPTDAGRPEPVLTAAPTLVLTDGAGSTITLAGDELALDGRPHAITLPPRGQPALPPGPWQVMAIDLLLRDHTQADLISWGTNDATVQLSVRLAGASGPGGEWSAGSQTGPGTVRPAAVRATADTVTATYSYSVLELSWQAAHLTLLGFPGSTQVPVAVSRGLAAELGLAVGDRIALSWDSTQLEAVVAEAIEYVPSHPRQAALLTDLTSLQRALLTAGRLESITTAWWIGTPGPRAAQTIRAAGPGPVTDRDETAADLRDGPLRSPVPYAWLLAIVVAVGLAIGGSAAQAAAQAQQRWSTVARLRAIGTSRREALASHFAQHAAVTALAVALGAVGGAVLAVALVPLLMVTPSGEPTVPSATLVWAAGPMSAVIGAVLLGGLLAGVPAAVTMVGRSTVTALRLGAAQ